jgi:3-phenylpropionate/cinnamic acid dioxygenase small subunit
MTVSGDPERNHELWAPSGRPVAQKVYEEVRDWMYLEAELLDGLREREWLERMVDESIIYRIPLRQTVPRARGEGFVPDAYHLNETHGSLSMRMSRLATEYAFGDDPPARTRHFISNIRVGATEGGALRAKSNVMLCRSRNDRATLNIMTGERHDEFRRRDGTLRLCSRIVLLDFTVLETPNLGTLF